MKEQREVDIESGQAIREERGGVGCKVKTRSECENQTERAEETLPRHHEGHTEVEQGHRLR